MFNELSLELPPGLILSRPILELHRCMLHVTLLGWTVCKISVVAKILAAISNISVPLLIVNIYD